MTDLLQALDLVVNAIFKQFTRKIRTKMIIKAFEEHKARREYANEDNIVQFKCRKPTVKEAIDNYYIILKNMKDNETLKQSITKSFINTGCAPDPDNSNNYKQYSETSQYSTRGLAVIPKLSSVALIRTLVIENLEENDDPDYMIVEAEVQEDVNNAMTET
jgi:hypothetical protein